MKALKPKGRLAGIAAVLLVLLGATSLAAHEGDEGIFLVIDEVRVGVLASVPFEQFGFVDTSGDGMLDAEELSAQRESVAPTFFDLVQDHVALTVDGESTAIVGTGVPAIATDGTGAEASTEVTLAIAFDAHDGDLGSLELWWTLETPTTKVVLSNYDEVITGDLNDDNIVSFSLSTWSSARSFFALGVEHIQFGPDHLLFLIVLTMAAVGTTVTSAATRRTVKLVTTFTLGHAISLALAYFEVISVPASLVEPAIALSIVAAALVTLRGKTTERPILAGFVGLVHGLGFASNLSSLGVAASKQLTAIAAFNLGVDIAQTVVVLAAIGALWLGTKLIGQPMSWVRTAIALSTAAIGLTWTASRLLELSA